MKWTLFLNFLIVALLFTLSSCNQESNSENRTSEDVTVIQQFNDLSPKFFNNSDTTYVINFWATTCPPCIKEMPHFNHLEATNNERPEKIFLISLDLERDLEKRVKPFVDKYEIKPEVVLLGDQNYTAWTERIDSSWMGALPATLIVKGDKRDFSFGAFETFEDLEAKLNNVMD